VAPLLLVWGQPVPEPPDWRHRLETVLLLSGVVAVGLVVFCGLIPSQTRDLLWSSLCLPLLVAIAFRLGVRRRTANLLLSAVAIWGTLHARGPFHRPDPNESLVLLQAFTAVGSDDGGSGGGRIRAQAGFAVPGPAGIGRQRAEGVVILAAGSAPSRPRIAFANEGFRRMTGLSTRGGHGRDARPPQVSPAT
jgi:hypothetical protein